MRDQLQNIEKEMNEKYLEREEVVRGLLVGLLAREHVLLLGPPGSSKSLMVEDLCSRITGSNYFRWLLSRTSAPEELLGPISLKALENDTYRRIPDGKLPKAHISLLDEVFKGSSAILNNLLSILNERMFFNNGAPEIVPLEMAVGASNELPAEREELAAIWDRFLLRYNVSYIQENGSFENMLRGIANNNSTTITLEDLKEAQNEAMQVDHESIIPTLIKLKDTLLEQGMRSSDRRYVKCIALIKANAYLEGRDVVNTQDISILSAVLWESPEEEKKVRNEILKVADPIGREIGILLDHAREIYKGIMSLDHNDPNVDMTGAAIEHISKLKKIGKDILSMIDKAQDTTRYEQADTTVREMREEIANLYLL